MALMTCRSTSTKAIASSLLILALLVSGCANNMALKKGQNELDLSGKSVALLFLRVSNKNRPSYQLDLGGVTICPGLDTCITKRYVHKVDAPYKREQDQYNEYLLSFNLDAGTQNIHYLFLEYDSAWLSAGTHVPIDLRTEIKANSIVYLGHVDVVLRERKKDTEERVAVFPVVSAPIVGFATGTFDVTVEDRFGEDIRLFTSEYPALQNARIEKSILPQWVRPEDRVVH